MAKNTESVRRQIARDLGGARFFALIASLPAWAVTAGSVYFAARIVFGRNDDPGDRVSAIVMGALLLLFAWLFAMVAGWSFSAVRAALTPQRVQAMWLRRFQSEGSDAFRTSRVIDRLSRHGVSALTLQDRDVQLSWEQRRNRLAPIFWMSFLPIAALLAIVGVSAFRQAPKVMENLPALPRTDNIAEGIMQAFGQALAAAVVYIFVLIVIILALAAATILTTLIVMLIASLAGPIGAFLSRNRDDYARLPGLIKRISAGKRPRGAVVLRISDANWRDAVRAGLSAADAAIIDLSSVTDHILWEIGEAVKACGAERLVFICREGPKGERVVAAPTLASVGAALGRAPGDIVYYPAKRGSERAGADFARTLRETVYDAADRRRAN